MHATTFDLHSRDKSSVVGIRVSIDSYSESDWAPIVDCCDVVSQMLKLREYSWLIHTAVLFHSDYN